MDFFTGVLKLMNINYLKQSKWEMYFRISDRFILSASANTKTKQKSNKYKRKTSYSYDNDPTPYKYRRYLLNGVQMPCIFIELADSLCMCM